MAGDRGLAKQIRTGLDQVSDESESVKEPHYLDQLYYGRPKRIHVSEFGAIIAIILFIIAGFKAYGGNALSASSWILVGIVIAETGYRLPAVLYPIWKGWMKFAHVLGAIMTFLILTVGWFLLVIPTALALRVFRIKVMDLRFNADVESYWEPRADKLHDFKLLERQI